MWTIGVLTIFLRCLGSFGPKWSPYVAEASLTSLSYILFELFIYLSICIYILICLDIMFRFLFVYKTVRKEYTTLSHLFWNALNKTQCSNQARTSCRTEAPSPRAGEPPGFRTSWWTLLRECRERRHDGVLFSYILLRKIHINIWAD